MCETNSCSQLPLALLEPLWKRVTPKNKVNECETLTFSNVSGQVGLKKQNPSISQFLTKMHQKVNDSFCGSESEIMERLSVDWGDEEGSQCRISCITKSFSIQEKCASIVNIFEDRKEDFEFKQMKKHQSLLQFLDQLAKVNPFICEQINNLMKDRDRVCQQYQNLLQREKKMEMQVKVLQSQIEILENKNWKIMEDFEELKKQFQYKNKLAEDKEKRKFERKLQEIKNQYDNKLRELNFDLETTTKNSLFASYDIKDKGILNHTNSNNLIQNNQDNFYTSRRRYLNMSQDRKQKSKRSIQQRYKNKANAQKEFESIIYQIIKPSTKSLGIDTMNSQKQSK